MTLSNAWPLLQSSNKSFVNLYLIIYIFDHILMVIALGFLIVSIYFMRNAGKYISLISTIDGETLPLLICIICSFVFMMHLLGAYIYWSIKENDSNQQLILCLRISIIVLLVAALSALIAIIIGVVETNNPKKEFKNGIVSYMNDYKSGGEASKTIDLLQIHFQCCGNDSYTEWFHIRWDSSMTESSTSRSLPIDSVPFSCCLKWPKSVCIHNQMKSDSSVYNYHPPDFSGVSRIGCYDALFCRAQQTVAVITICLGIFSMVEISLAIAKRVQETSLTMVHPTNDKYRVAWIFGSNSANLRKNQETQDEHQQLLNEPDSSSPEENFKSKLT